jgi:hypothetical protein
MRKLTANSSSFMPRQLLMLFNISTCLCPIASVSETNGQCNPATATTNSCVMTTEVVYMIPPGETIFSAPYVRELIAV